MEITLFSEAFINNSSDISINKSNSAILCRNVLKKYENELLDNIDGCIFKLTYVEPVTKWIFIDYVSCKEFTAPDFTAYIPDNIYFNMCSMHLDNLKNTTIELYNPPQATHITLRLSNELLDLIPDLKNTLEILLNNNFKFIKLGQYIDYLEEKILVSELEPHNICLINNTDLEVDFEIVTKNQYVLDNDFQQKNDTVNTKIDDIPVNTNEAINTVSDNKPTLDELRNKRLQALSNK